MSVVRGKAAEKAGQDVLERALVCAFWRSVQQNPIPAMAALEAAARAVGHLYRQMAQAHGDAGTCGCGWRPEAGADLLVLEAMLSGAALPRARLDLANLPALGRA